MGRRREENIFEVLVYVPWWVGVAFAVVTYCGLKWILPSLSEGNPILIPLSKALSNLAWMFSALFLIPAVISLLKQSPSKSRRPNPVLYNPGPSPESVDRNAFGARQEISMPPMPPMPRLKVPPKRPDSWSLPLLRSLEWYRFEKLAADFYDASGYKSRVTRQGADGGVDVELFSAGEEKTTTLLQCKAWNTYKVGVKPVRELFGVMAAQKVPNGIFLTTGEFTSDARDFARDKSLELIDGATLLARILKMPADVSRGLLERATEGDYTTPTCPKCGIKMTKRSGNNGAFWGCVRYPRCRQTFALPK